MKKVFEIPLFSTFAKCKAKAKGGLISESFSLRLKSPKMGAKSQPSALRLKREDAHCSEL